MDAQTTETKYGPALSVTGVTKSHARRAITWLRNRSILAFYGEADKSLNTFPTKFGPERDYKAMHDALEATR